MKNLDAFTLLLTSDVWTCVYCGDPAEEWDHVVPASWTDLIPSRASNAEDRVVQSCKWCNRTLSDLALFTIPKRAEYLAIRLYKKHKRLLNGPRWFGEDDPDFWDLKNHVKGHVETEQLIRASVELRLKHLEIISTSDLSVRQARYLKRHGPKVIE
ncbi:hypothetical protein [Candidatus Poriferisocius sp.]|uniref:hypothetical protein n=1 Tax=Candidatus Poriferisocius sp. TaxID=3101276 RepID=UPI003B020110